jgi:hypothetical protein
MCKSGLPAISLRVERRNMDNTRAAHSTVNHAGIAPSDRLRILVLGYIVRGPLGGMAWSDMHYLAGLRALGHDVYFFEDSGDSPWCCYDPAQGKTDSDPSYGLEFASRALESIGMGSRWAYYDAHRSRWNGPCAGQARQICAGTDVLLNMYGADKLHPWMTEIPVRVLIDKDPVFTQVRHLTDPVVRAAAEEHTVFFTFGENFGKEGTTMPADGLDWQVTRRSTSKHGRRMPKARTENLRP